MQQTEVELPGPVVVSVKRRRRRRAFAFSSKIFSLLAEPAIALYVLLDREFHGVQLAEAQDKGASAAEDHRLGFSVRADIGCHSLRERYQHLLDLATLATRAKCRAHLMHLDRRNVAIVRPPVAHEAYFWHPTPKQL